MKMMPKAVRVTSRLSNTAQQLSNLSMFKTKYKKKTGKKKAKQSRDAGLRTSKCQSKCGRFKDSKPVKAKGFMYDWNQSEGSKSEKPKLLGMLISR